MALWFSSCFANAATLQWDRNPEANVIGYRVYVGRVSRGYDSVLDIGNLTSAEVPTPSGTTFYAVTAYDSAGLESGFSAEVTYTSNVNPPNSPPTAQQDTYATTMNTPLNVPTASGVLLNDSDPDGNPLSAAVRFPMSNTESYPRDTRPT